MSFRTIDIPSKDKVGYLDPEIAGEGERVSEDRRVLLSDGEEVVWTPPQVAPTIPDWSKIKSIAHYFGRTGYQTWPAWLYHPTEAPRVVRNAAEAAKFGVRYRKASSDERGRYGVTSVWDYADDSKWRSQPYEKDAKFDPAKPGTGKIVSFGAPNPAIAQNELVRALIPEVAAAVAQAMQSNGPAKPANIDQAEWDEFKAFMAFKKSTEVVAKLDDAAKVEDEAAPLNALGEPIAPDQERAIWEEEAERRGVKIDGRWSIARLKAEVEKAA